MAINNKVGWVIIIVVAAVIAFFVLQRSKTPEGTGLPEAKKGVQTPAGSPQTPQAPEPGGGSLIIYFPSR